MAHTPHSGFSRRLIAWYARARRDMPWRRTADPYAIWLSEVMLQQTQVVKATPYFERWIARFPTLVSVARADEDAILKHWEGLGYYARARNFHRACQIVRETCGGRVPDDPDAFRRLPGVGDYICAAVQSIAFGRPLAVIDGNVKRVVSRYLALGGAPARALPRIKTFVETEISRRRPGDFNQAMMELGATVCVKHQPMCARCPVAGACAARRCGQETLYPAAAPRKKRPHYQVTAGVIWRGAKVLISKRKAGGLLAGLWEFPGGKCERGECLEDCLKREIKEELAVDVAVGTRIATIKHAYTHFSVEVHFYHCRYLGGRVTALGCADYRWVRPQHVFDFPFPASNTKMFSMIAMKNPFLARKGRKKRRPASRGCRRSG